MANSKSNIYFDGEYATLLVKTLTGAKSVLDEALDSLKSANRHEGWECSEREQINEELGEISKKLERVKKGLDDGASAIGKGAEMFASLEDKASENENAVSEQVKKNWVFEAAKWVGGAVGSVIGGAVEWVKGAVGSVIGGIGNMIGGIGEKKPVPITPIYPSPELPPVTTLPPKTNPNPTLEDLIEPGLPDWVPRIPDWLLKLIPSLNDKSK
jgi:hypothetical protein